MPAKKPASRRRPTHTKRTGSDGWTRYESKDALGRPAFVQFTKSYGALSASVHRTFPADNPEKPWAIHLTINGPRMSGSFDSESVGTLNTAFRAVRAELTRIRDDLQKHLLADLATTPVLGTEDGP